MSKGRKIISEKEALAWIQKITGKAPKNSSSVYESLRDGKLLCETVNKIQPGTIARINNKPVKYLEIENISLFIRACKKVGVPQQDCMSAVDLYDGSNLRQVLICIESYGRHVQGIDGYNLPCLGAKLTKKRDSMDEYRWDLGYKYDDDDGSGIKWTVKTEEGKTVKMTHTEYKKYQEEQIQKEEVALERERRALSRAKKETKKQDEKNKGMRGRKGKKKKRKKGDYDDDPVKFVPKGKDKKKMDLELKGCNVM